MEFALVLPLLLLFILGIIEVGRMLAIFSSVSSAAKQATRYGAVGGDSGNGIVYYLDCAGMRRSAQSTSLLQSLTISDISIRYDHGLITSTFGLCATNAITPTLSTAIVDGDRVVISITTIYQPLVPIVPLPPIPITFVAAHTIFTTIIGPTPTPVPNPDLALSKVGSPNLVLPGSTSLMYEMIVTNTGAIEASGVVLTDTLPASINPNTVILPAAPSSPAAGWTCTRVGQVVTCTLPFLGSLNTAPPIDLHVTAPITPGVITNTARVAYNLTDPQPTNNIATATTTISTSIDLSLQNIDLVDPVGAGQPITYALNVTNNGSVAATLQTVTDTLPANTTFVSASGSGWTFTQGAGGLTFTRNTSLAVGGTTPTITVVLLAPLPSFVPAGGFVTAQASAASQLSDPYPLNNTNIVVTTTVTTQADLAVFKFGPGSADSDSVYVYTLRATNNGPSVATGVQIVDNVPAAIQSIAAGAGWTCSTSGTTLTCVYGLTLQPQTTTTDIVISVKAPSGNVTIANSALVSSDEPDGQSLNNSATVTTTVSNCHPGLVDAAHSSVSAAPGSVYADNFTTARILVTLKDACDNVIVSPPADPQQVTLTSSRGAQDTLTVAGGYANPTTTGQVAFDVKSGTVGASTYSVSARNTNTNASVNLTATALVNFNAYNCIDDLGERPLVGGNQTNLQFILANNSGFARRLLAVSLNLPNSPGQKTDSLTLQATTLWSVSPGNNSSAILIGSGGLAWDATGTDAARTLANGALNQTLQFNFSKSVSGTGSFVLTTTWDDGTGARTCAKSITVTH